MNSSETKAIQEKKLFLGLAKIYKLRDGSTRFRISYGKLSVSLVLFFVVGWISILTAAFFHFKYRRDYADVSYVETLLMPFHQRNFQKKRGEYYIETAFRSMEAGDYKKALNFLRNGLLRSPDNLKARRTLAEFYEFIFNRPELAFDLLSDGFPSLSGLPEQQINEYIQNLFAVGSRNQLDEKLINGGISILSELGNELSDPGKALVSYQIASAYRNKGEVDKAQELIDSAKLLRFSEGLVLQAQLFWDKGEEDLAIELLLQRLNQYKENRAIYEKLISLLDEKQLADKARQYALLYQLQHPQAFQSHLARLQQYYKHNRTDPDSINGFVEEYLNDFGSNAAATRQLAILSSKFGDVDNTRKIIEKLTNKSSENELLLGNFILIESMIRAGQYTPAIAILKDIESGITEDHPLNPDSNSILLSLKTAAYHGSGDEIAANQSLNELIKSPVIKIDRYLAVAYLFLEVDAPDIALKIMNHCLETQVYNVNVMEALIATYVKSGDVDKLSQVLTEAIDTRRLPNKLLIDSYRLLSSDRNIHIKKRTRVMDKIQHCFSTDYLFKEPNT